MPFFCGTCRGSCEPQPFWLKTGVEEVVVREVEAVEIVVRGVEVVEEVVIRGVEVVVAHIEDSICSTYRGLYM